MTYRVVSPTPAPSAPTSRREHRCRDAQSHAQALAQCVARQLVAAVQQRGRALLAVSGGRSPVAFFTALRAMDVPWSQVCITPVDERCVPSDHPDSNARLVREHLLQERAAAATFAAWLDGLDPTAHTPEGLAAHAQTVLAELPWPCDVTVLGMGEDGHTASWFPASDGLSQVLDSLERVTWVRPSGAAHLRLTLTHFAVLASRHLHLAIAGEAKQRVYAQALQSRSTALPVSLVLHDAHDLDVWMA